ncbi:hypothetical protein [Acidiphilium sp.]|uniref:hypothetical protein n=1 Tax=Acidiphilium sp. TaxID=527 RepID=UPI002CFF10D7|nr:hypothetical protein [Acidiphilium sp.]HQT62765.1 hypothetical protein [Acidiphilium sp.]
MIDAAIILACAVLMRLRGGAFTTLTRLNPGTDGARGGFSVAVAALFLSPALGVTLFLGLIVTGWGPFQGLGLPSAGAPERSWMRWLPERLGFAPGTIAHDVLGLAQSGVVFLAPTAALLAWLVSPLAGVTLLGAGPLWPVAYAIPRIVRLPTIPRFASGQAWGECFTGAILGTALILSMKGL